VLVDLAPIRYLSLSAGIGAGSNGVQTAGHARFRVPLPGRAHLVAFGLGIGLSRGKYAPINVLGCCDAEPRVTTWTNLDLQLEVRAPNGLNARVYVGRGVYDDFYGNNDIAYVGTAFGYAMLD
jgi:hypothetical protein